MNLTAHTIEILVALIGLMVVVMAVTCVCLAGLRLVAWAFNKDWFEEPDLKPQDRRHF